MKAPTPDPEFRTLIEAVAADESKTAFALLKKKPDLAQRTALVGASRAEAKAHYFEAIAHYLNEGDTPLHMAAAGYRVAIVQRLLALGADPRARNRMGAEPLHYACDGGPYLPHWNPAAQAEVIALLIKAGADPNALNKQGVAPLHRAVRTRCSAAVKALLAHGADAQLPNKSGSAALDLASLTTGRGGSGSEEAKAEQEKIIRMLNKG